MTSMLPLQTRGVFLEPSWLHDPARLSHLQEEVLAAGMNTVLFPILHDGAPTLRVDAQGALVRPCGVQDALEAFSRSGISIYLTLDLLTAGEPGSGRLGPLAKRNGAWLMRSISGDLPPPAAPQVPALFCWSALEFRRYVSNYLVSVVEAFPADGVVLDLRLLPRTTHDMKTWTHFGYTCLRRMGSELRIDLDAFLSRPSIETLERIEAWRLGELVAFIEGLKARSRHLQDRLPFTLLARPGRAADPFLPWASAARSGIIDVLGIEADEGELVETLHAVDDAVEEPIPQVALFGTAEELAAARGTLGELALDGFFLLRTGLPLPGPLAVSELEWPQQGAVEAAPLEAVQAIVAALAVKVEGTKRLAPFLTQLRDYLGSNRASMKYEDAMKIRRDIQGILRKLKDPTMVASPAPFDLPATVRQLDRAARLLRLAPLPKGEH